MTFPLRRLILMLLLLLPAHPSLAGEVSVFVYHRFGDPRYPSTNIALETFDAQLAYLREHDYRVLPLGEIVRRIQGGDPLPERCAALTVDDAYRTFLTGALPLLRRYGYPATLFVSTDLVGRPDYLDWNELRRVQEEGVEIGNHSASHGYLLDRRPGESEGQWKRRVAGDVSLAQRLLEKELGRVPGLFAYPFGEYSPALVGVVRELGFEGAAAQQSGVITDESFPFTLPRFPMGGPYATLEGFRRKLRMKALPVEVISPATPVVGDRNPPVLIVRIDPRGLDLDRLRCFVPGETGATVRRDPAAPGRFIVVAGGPLSGRRSKYTLTAPGKGDGEWYWFSQLWILGEGLPAGSGLEGGEEPGR